MNPEQLEASQDLFLDAIREFAPPSEPLRSIYRTEVQALLDYIGERKGHDDRFVCLQLALIAYGQGLENVANRAMAGEPK
jgi:hypothetical protein